jgi:tetratricopeptide (TPR) repeat protein
LYYKLGKHQVSIEDFSQCIQLDPYHFSAYIGRGTVYYSDGKYQEAVNDFTRSIGIEKDFRAFYKRGLALAALGKYQEAINDYNIAIDIFNESGIDSNIIITDIYEERRKAYQDLQGQSEE